MVRQVKVVHSPDEFTEARELVLTHTGVSLPAALAAKAKPRGSHVKGLHYAVRER